MKSSLVVSLIASLVVVAACSSAPSSPPVPPGLELIAGSSSGPGNLDGVGHQARFSRPFRLAFDGASSFYIADSGNQSIRKVSATGQVTTVLATDPASAPDGVAVDRAGNLYIADAGGVIRKLDPSGQLTLLAGQQGVSGTQDGTGAAAQFSSPGGLAVDGNGNVFVADELTIRRITPAGEVTAIATHDATGAAVTFKESSDVAIAPDGRLIVADAANSTIDAIATDGTVTILAGSPGQFGAADGVGSAARFNIPDGVAVDPSGNIFVTDSLNQAIRKISPTGQVTTLAGAFGKAGAIDGTGAAARFCIPFGLAFDANGVLYVSETANDDIRTIAPDGTVATLAGDPAVVGKLDGKGEQAQFDFPAAVAVDPQGNFYIADSFNEAIRKVTPAGEVTTFVGGHDGIGDGEGLHAEFSEPQGIAIDQAGNVYVADTDGQTIRAITPGGGVTTLAGTGDMSGSADGIGPAARFNLPLGLAVDGRGAIYVADSGNHTIRKINSSNRTVTTIAGVPGQSGFTDGPAATARFNSPGAIAVDSDGTVYVADTYNNAIRAISPAGTVTTVATGLHTPQGITVKLGTVYVADTGAGVIRQIHGGKITTVAGTPGTRGIILGASPGLSAPTSLALAGTSLVIIDSDAVLSLNLGDP